MKLLSDLEDWLKKMEARLSQEKETVLKAKDAAQIAELLKHYQALISPLSTLTFFCASLSALEQLYLNSYFNISAFILPTF